ncbi:MAG: hypothetical protein V1716_02510 [Candidatus Uhrbacteria bacterium]
MLKRFFAVTFSGSVYEVGYTEPDGKVVAKKIAKRQGEKNPIEIGDSLEGGDRIAIVPVGLLAYHSETREIGSRSTAIVALFLDVTTAMTCFNELDTQPLDKRWRQETEAALDEIGESHPAFTVFAGKYSLRQPNKTSSPTTE